MQIGLYFGSFNPVHIGHMAIANYIVEFTELNQLWFVVSPHNPLKNKTTLLKDYHRLELVNIAIENDNRFRASNIEFGLPKPSYTIDTLVYLKEKYPEYNFALIMGADNLQNFHKWKNYKQILDNYKIYVYPRPNIKIDKKYTNMNNIITVNAPVMEISSSFIRNAVGNGKNISHFLPHKVYKYITEMHFFEKK